jgi:hypothetical protein
MQISDTKVSYEAVLIYVHTLCKKNRKAFRSLYILYGGSTCQHAGQGATESKGLGPRVGCRICRHLFSFLVDRANAMGGCSFPCVNTRDWNLSFALPNGIKCGGDFIRTTFLWFSCVPPKSKGRSRALHFRRHRKIPFRPPPCKFDQEATPWVAARGNGDGNRSATPGFFRPSSCALLLSLGFLPALVQPCESSCHAS